MFGLPELIILAAIAFLILGAQATSGALARVTFRLHVEDVAAGATTVPAEAYGATPDRRYARGIRAGALAELFGLGLTGVRWRQVGVVLVGGWLSGSGITLYRVGIENLSAPNLILMALWPAVFVFSAITAIRSFQGRILVAISTGAMYSLLYTSVRVVASSQNVLPTRETSFWMQAAASSFVWPVLTIFALDFAVSGTRRWVRMACGLFVASVVGMYVNDAIYSENWNPERVDLGPELTTMIGSALIWTAAFWIGELRYGQRNDLTPRV